METTMDKLKKWLIIGAFALLLMATVAYCILAIFFKGDLPEGLKTLLTVIVTGTLLNVKEVFGWVFGSSESSQKKDETIAKLSTGETK